MSSITVGVLTVSDSCYSSKASDTSGLNLVQMINGGILKNAKVVETAIVPDVGEEIKKKLLEWCDTKKMNVIFTTGGTGVAPRDVTPEATLSLLDREIPGIPSLIFKRSSEVTPLAALSRGVAGVRGKSLIINLPGSKKASEECLEAVSTVIGHAVDLVCDVKASVEKLHLSLQTKKSKVKAINEEERVRKSPYSCLKVVDAQAIVFERTYDFRKEKNMAYEKSLGYVLAKQVNAIDNLPPFNASIKDGYAILSFDKSNPKRLIERCAAGALPENEIKPGCCISVNTGAPIPEGADAVVPVEDTFIRKSGGETQIGITSFPPAGENIRPKGSDFKEGSLLVAVGTYLGSSALGQLAAAGILSVTVFDKPVVSVLSTGDEIVNPEDKLGPGQVRDSNRVTLISMLKEEGFQAHDLGIVKDEPDALYSRLSKAFIISDVVVTTGSMSMGDRDYLKEVLMTDFGAEVLFGAVFMKPGKPTAFATLNYEGKKKIWFGLPGNPASAVVTTHLFMLPALRNISGNANLLPPRVVATLTFDIHQLDRPHYHRGVLTYTAGKFSVATTGSQSSSRVGSCLDANCLIEIAPGIDVVRQGSQVSVLVIGKHF
ncbi:hypothetical protein RUM43_007801 [Polyplax serrata]|uniref:MoaB/Mog domain-containing protein n=1 Tax=Polyplax serrata TaxID=468196 RepID=A0AAN8S1Z6_POLSC